MDCQVDFARAYDSVAHDAILACMRRCGVPHMVSAANLREFRSAAVHIIWRTEGVNPEVGLGQGCFLSPMSYRFAMTDILSESTPPLLERGSGMNIGTHMLHLLCWADATWVVRHTTGLMKSDAGGSANERHWHEPGSSRVCPSARGWSSGDRTMCYRRSRQVAWR